MANINVPELNPVGSDLFFDTENFMTELNDQEFDNVKGGLVAPDQPLPASPLTPVVHVGSLYLSPVLVNNQISKLVQSIRLGGF